ncbi:MAG: EAL domain-containing protein [Acidimicrobiia bacterium]
MTTDFDAVASSRDPATVPSAPLDLQELAARLILVAESTTDLIGLTDGQGRVVYLNPAARRQLGFDVLPEALTLDALLPPRAFGQYYEDLRPQLLRGEPWSGEMVMHDVSGRPFRVRQTVVAQTDAGGEVVGLATIGHVLDEPAAPHASGDRPVAAPEEPTAMMSGLLDAADAALAHELAVGIGRNAITVHYQPMIEIATGLVKSVEVFARWLHARRGMLDASEFVDVANRTGLVVPLGLRVLREACTQGSRWLHSSSATAPRVHVNVSVRQLEDPGFVDLVCELLVNVGLPAEWLCAEVDGVALLGSDAGVAAVHRLRDRGVLIAAEVGSTDALIDAAKVFPVDACKISGVLVGGIMRARGRAEVGTLVDRAHAHGMAAIATRVEMSGQLAALRSLDCDLAQGLFFSRPRRADGVGLLFGRRFVA